jgi:titin
VDVRGDDADANLIRGNYVGTNVAGTAAVPNSEGVLVALGATNTVIGGAIAGARNVIAGNTSIGIQISSAGTAGTVIQGNVIGVNAAGTAALANGLGILVSNDANGTTIGGTTALARNIISGNTRAGVVLDDVSGTTVQGNYIGTGPTGATALPNAHHGIVVHNAAHDNRIGGTTANARNVIAFNGGAGVLIGSDTSHNYNGAAGVGNSVLGNSIFGNTGLGIDLGAFDGVTANDSGDTDGGPNLLMNYPVLYRAVSFPGDGTYVSGTLSSGFIISASFRIEFFSDPSPDASGYGEGRFFLGAITLRVTNSFTASFTAVLPVVVAPGGQVTATATDPDGNTSEFSLNVTVM